MEGENKDKEENKIYVGGLYYELLMDRYKEMAKGDKNSRNN